MTRKHAFKYVSVNKPYKVPHSVKTRSALFKVKEAGKQNKYYSHCNIESEWFSLFITSIKLQFPVVQY